VFKQPRSTIAAQLSNFIRHICVCALFAGLIQVAQAEDGEQKLLDKVKEYQIKALFLYNFANFVSWPNRAFEGDSSPLKLCLVGAVPFGGFLDTVNGTLIGDRALSVIRDPDGNSDQVQAGCHILFVGFNKKSELQSFFNNLNHTFVLSVGDEPRFADEWGTVNIYRVRDSQRVEINLKKAMDNGLVISSDLLAISKVIQ